MEEPAGLRYEPNFLSAAEEEATLAFLGALEYEPVTMRGQTARRTVRHFGLGYGYESRALTPTEPLPGELEWLRDRAAGLAGVQADELAETLVTRYPSGAGIGWHRDAPMFAKVVGVSLGAPSRMRFQRRAGDVRRVWELVLEPRSAYVLSGSARWAWQHSIPAVAEARYSVTFRTLRDQ
ncbi:MAG TPA: alpha-ketoglutarate-dependent dioxygenase AlkB [Gaiellaceae bacterium]|nr:alpha-ketoglutarate-dependent dioxygenase AlkB [Gaiellaceae bacterium]